MKRTILFACALALWAMPVASQEDLLGQCSPLQLQYSYGGAPYANVPPPQGGAQVQDQIELLCGQVVTAMEAVQPSIGIAFSGGNPVLGTATTIGRRFGLLPRISLTARVNGAFTDVPELLDGYEAQLEDGDLPPLGTTGIPVAAIQGDVAIGLFNGLSLGPALGGFGAIDLLGSVAFIPAVEETGLEEDIINWGAGARIGLLKQGLIMPGLSISGLYRSMGRQTFGNVEEDDPAQFSSDLETISLRAAISKGILAFDLAAGAGYDIYTSDVEFDFELVCPAQTCGVEARARPEVPIQGELETAAWNVYGNVGLSLLVLNIVGELGYQKATEVIGPEDFEDAGLPAPSATDEELDGGRLFASVGIRFTF